MTRVSYPRAPSEFSLLYRTQGTDNTNLVNNSVTSESSCSCTHRVTGNIYKGNEKTLLILGAAITSSEEERNTRSPEFPWSPNRSWQETISHFAHSVRTLALSRHAMLSAAGSHPPLQPHCPLPASLVV